MVSEDSDQIMSGLSAIHRLSNLRDIRQTRPGPMGTDVDHLDTARELLEITLLRRMHRVRDEEGDDRLDQILPPAHHIAVQVLRVVVVSPVGDDATHIEEIPKLVKTRGAPCALRHRELVGHLIASLVAFSAGPIWLPDKPDGEASLSVYKTYNPAELNQPFLLVFCTHGIVTVQPAWDGTRSLGYSVFPAYSQMRTAQLPVRGATNYLRTVIVTAAVYRGLASLLWAEALTTPRNLPAPGRRQPLYVVFRLSRDLCFW
jgi:hypothetical protein